jgi:hypothetical protein
MQAFGGESKGAGAHSRVWRHRHPEREPPLARWFHPPPARQDTMTDLSRIKEHMEVIGADGAHVGTVDRVEGKRIKLTKKDSGEGSHKGHHHYIDGALVADVEGNKVRLSANGNVAVTMEQEA